MASETVASPTRVIIRAQRLTEEAFRPYGRIVGTSREPLTATDTPFAANLVHLRRVGGTIDYINRHLDHSQMFVPLLPIPVVVVVAPPEQPMIGFDPGSIVAFITASALARAEVVPTISGTILAAASTPSSGSAAIRRTEATAVSTAFFILAWASETIGSTVMDDSQGR